MKKPLVIGIGNPLRGDDGAGLELARFLESRLQDLVETEYCHGNLLELMDRWRDRERVFLIDAVSTENANIGALHQFAAHKDPVPAIFSQASTHLMDIVQVIELSKVLGKMPEKLILFGIEGKRFHLETGISKELKAMLDDVAERIEQGIRKAC